MKKVVKVKSSEFQSDDVVVFGNGRYLVRTSQWMARFTKNSIKVITGDPVNYPVSYCERRVEAIKKAMGL